MTRRRDLACEDLFDCDHAPTIAISDGDAVVEWRCACGQRSVDPGDITKAVSSATASLTRVDFLSLGAFMPLCNPSGQPLNGGRRAVDLERRGLLVFVERDGGSNYYQITDAGRAAWKAHRDG